MPGAREVALSMLAGGSLSLPAAWAGNPVLDDIPPVALAAYVNAAAMAPCPIDYRVVAAVGKVESNHGRFGGAHLKADGDLAGTIVSSAGAQGVTQFMPETGRFYADTFDIDGNRDGVEDFDNVWDSALATATKLCSDGVLTNETEAVGAYNGGANWTAYAESRAYVVAVRDYQSQLPEFDARTMTPVEKDRSIGALIERQWQRFVVAPWLKLGQADGPARDVWRIADDAAFGPTTASMAKPDGFGESPRGDKLDPQFGGGLDRMIAAAPGEITIGSGYRDAAEQMALREQHCPDPVLSPSTDCTPATAMVGTSDHERGLAADLRFDSPATEAWAHSHASDFGLEFDLLHLGETWHVSIAS